MNAEAAKNLREPFPAEQIGKLPRLTCKACRDSPSKACGQHSKSNCQVCGNYISPRHIHLDYVGHAATTDRLLQVDPEWSWRPFTVDELAGVGAQKGELWIWLTIGGTTRPGVGDGATAKERIGDAIRNGAMRFGVALDLWAKEDLRAEEHEPEAAPPPNASPNQSSTDSASTAQNARLHALISELAGQRGVPREQVQTDLKNALGIESMSNLSKENAKKADTILKDWSQKLGATA